MCSGLVAREDHEYDRDGHDSIVVLLCGTHPLSKFKILLFSFFSKKQEVSCDVFTTDHGASFGSFVEDHVKDDAGTCEDVVERDVDGYATQKVLSWTLNAQPLDVQ